MKRIKCFDLLRVFCFLLIIYYHMVAQLPVNGICTYADIWPFVANENIQIGTFAVAVFFMLSGASLMYSTQGEFKTGKYYLKRYIRLLIPFYVVTFMNYIVNAVRVRDLAGVYVGGIPVWRWIFTILGMDEWVAMHGIVTFSRGIGEWFLGELIILSFLFPLFRWFMIKNQKAVMLVMTTLYLMIIFNYQSEVLIYMSILVKGYDFVLGMWLGLNWQKISTKWMYITIPIVLIYLLCPIILPINEALRILLFAVAFLISFSCLENHLQDRKLSVINWLSKYSYELFLVHHLVIYALTPHHPSFIEGINDILFLFAVELVIIFVIAIIAKFVSDKIISVLWRGINLVLN